MEILVIGLVCNALVAAWANARGRSAVAWFILSLVVTPIATALLLAILPKRNADATSGGLASSIDSWSAAIGRKADEINARSR